MGLGLAHWHPTNINAVFNVAINAEYGTVRLACHWPETPGFPAWRQGTGQQGRREPYATRSGKARATAAVRLETCSLS
jgi:hypothetical protein